jgi:hypothetical protein
MRPLQRPPWNPEWEGARATDVVRHVLGRYCATCERPLPQAAVAWHADAARAVPDVARPSEWDDLLALCNNCAAAARESGAGAVEPLRPDRDRTLVLDAPSPILYAPPTAEARAGVRPGDARGGATVVRFGLDRHVPVHPFGEELFLPDEPDEATLDFWDPRHEQRDAAWRDAEAALDRLLPGPPAVRDVLVDQLARLAEARGFWSVWATVVWDRTHDRDLLATVLLPQAAHHAFVGTREDWLPS